MIRFSVFIVFAFLLLVSPLAMAQDVYCDSDPGPSKINIKVGNGTLIYNQNLNTAKLQHVAQKSGVKTSAGTRAMGLTTAILGTKYKIKTRLVPASNGGLCVFFSEVKAFVGITKLTVYIDNKYRRGTCQYNQILKHEGLHVSIFRRYARDAGIRFRDELPRAMDRISPMLASNRAEASEILSLLQQEMEPMLEQNRRDQTRENAALDTLRSYRLLNQKCPNW